jgi:hypothetical protein
MAHKKPANATYVGKAKIDFDAGTAEILWQQEEAHGHRFGTVEIALYKDAERDRTIVKFDHAGPAVIRQSYGMGRGKDAIVEWATDTE